MAALSLALSSSSLLVGLPNSALRSSRSAEQQQQQQNGFVGTKFRGLSLRSGQRGGAWRGARVRAPAAAAAAVREGQAGISFQQFDGLRGQGLVESRHSVAVSTKAYASAFAVKASSAVADPPAVAAPSKQKIRIKLRSYWVPRIEQACQQILDAAKNTNAITMGPVPLPTKRRLYCVLRSPHVDKDSREHFEIRTHLRLIDLSNPNAQTIDALMQLDLPSGVDVEVKLS